MVQMLLPLAAGAAGQAFGFFQTETGKTVLKIAAAGGVVYLSYRGYKYLRARRTAGSYGEDSNKGLTVDEATVIYNAIVTSGSEWINDNIGDGTNELQLWKSAEAVGQGKIKSDDLIKAYRKLYGRELLKDVNADLDGNEQRLFNDLFYGRTTLAAEKAKRNPLLFYYPGLGALSPTQIALTTALLGAVGLLIAANRLRKPKGTRPADLQQNPQAPAPQLPAPRVTTGNSQPSMPSAGPSTPEEAQPSLYVWLDTPRWQLYEGSIYTERDGLELGGKSTKVTENTYLGRGRKINDDIMVVFPVFMDASGVLRRYKIYVPVRDTTYKTKAEDYRAVMADWGEPMSDELKHWIRINAPQQG